MITTHIKDIKFNEIWIITLKSGATIEGTLNLAESVNKANLYCYPQPELSRGSQILDPELEAA